MKKFILTGETKKKIAAISALFALATFICTFVLVIIEHPAQWYAAGACMVGMIITFLFTCLTEN